MGMTNLKLATAVAARLLGFAAWLRANRPFFVTRVARLRRTGG